MKRFIPRKILELFLTLLKSNSTKTEVADGLAIGVFIALLPIMGLQMYISLALTRLFKKNTLVALLAAWITNPLTAVPIYLFNIWVGNFLYKDPVSIRKLERIVASLDSHNILAAGKDILIPLWIGSVIVGVASAFISQKLCMVYYDKIKTHFLKKSQHDTY